MLLISATSVGAATRDVCPTCLYTSISDALIASADGDTIRVAAGTYLAGGTIQGSGWSLTLEGGYNESFTARDGETILQGGLSIGGYNSGSITIDGFTIEGTSGDGISLRSVNSSYVTHSTIRNCTIYGSTGNGIYVNSAGTTMLEGNRISDNAGSGISISHYGVGGVTSMVDNVIHGHTCSSCSGIYEVSAPTGGLIRGNAVYGNRIGVNLEIAGATSSPVISSNRIHSNDSIGLYVIGGAASIHHNLVHDNEVAGIRYVAAQRASLLHNVVANNGDHGAHFVSGNSSNGPYIRNNIFYGGKYGLYFSGSANGTGWIHTIPSRMAYNAFHAQSYHPLVVYNNFHLSRSSEVPGRSDDVNGFAWSDANILIDPGFIDPSLDDFRLRGDSFLIDEGDPADGYASEPVPNGARVNIGHEGDTTLATISGGAPSVSNVSAVHSGPKVEITFDAAAVAKSVWITAEYWDGTTYILIPPSELSGDSYVEGYRTGRIEGGTGRTVSWDSAGTVLSGQRIDSNIRLTVEHGEGASTSESNDFVIDLRPTPTPTPTEVPSPSPTPTIPSATPTPVVATPSPTVTVPFSPTPLTPTATPIPTETPAPTATYSPVITPDATRTPIPTETPAPTAPYTPSVTPEANPTGTPYPTAAATPDPRASDLPPEVLAYRTSVKRGSRISFVLSLKDDRSSKLKLHIELTVNHKRRLLKNAVVRARQARSVPTKMRVYLRGNYRYCVTATDDGGNTASSCSVVRVR